MYYIQKPHYLMDYQNQGNNKNTVRSCRKSQIKQYTLFLYQYVNKNNICCIYEDIKKRYVLSK